MRRNIKNLRFFLKSQSPVDFHDPRPTGPTLRIQTQHYNGLIHKPFKPDPLTLGRRCRSGGLGSIPSTKISSRATQLEERLLPLGYFACK
ncbi:hypothetical protein NL676_031494 [Syzygium grande]|nr:hypothetical protein NL676_031494 [Syzygium grande]